ncbi:hypothetical protein LJ737_25805 [Hymenobacter sp. 15J16-1T3B]|uniref:hypothetical protein n=1 Tax=Hymenobacter sp. 15J16-1T3B TaxID=2886941 RepID=UPI001D129E5E|nr:hypothetical protein [Hymenobacter sp. 15J16-1T3B]MCC3160678.1 hypothetical protein [Hymenobacter sp. 15J16-1T3B]
MHRISWLLVLLALLAGACTKERIKVVTEPARARSWTLDSSLTSYNRILLTSARQDDSTLVVASNTALWYVRPRGLNRGINGAFLQGIPTYGYLVAPTITPAVGTILYDANRLGIFLTASPISNFGRFTYAPTYSTDPNTNKAFPLPIQGNSGYPVVDGRYVLAPTEGNSYWQLGSVLRVGPIAGFRPGESLELKNTRLFTLTPAPAGARFVQAGYFAAAYHHKFFVSMGGQFFRVDTTGRVKAFGYSPVPGTNAYVTQMFTLQNRLFAVGNSTLFVSDDQGETWAPLLNLSGTNLGLLTFHNVGAALYATFQAQLWRVTLSANSLVLKELDNDGLATNQITSVNTCGKYAFVTTLAGFYYRDTASFQTPKRDQ